MATSAATAASSDSNRTAYARNLDSGNDSNRLRLDGATLSAFDLLLELPIFDNQILPAETNADRESVDDLKEDDQSIADDEDSRSSGAETNPNPTPLPIANRIEETLKRDTYRSEITDRKVDGEQVRETDGPSGKDTHRSIHAEVSSTARPDQPTEINPTVSLDHSHSELKDKPTVELAKPTDSEPLVAAPALDHRGIQHDEFVEEPPVTVDVPSRHREHKAKNERSSDENPKIEPTPGQSPVKQALDAKHSKKFEKNQTDQELAKRSNNTTPFVNRRSERLAESKRGEQSNDSNDEHEREVSEAVKPTGSFEMPNELTVENELGDLTQSITLSGTELTDPSATRQDASLAIPSASTPILSTGVVATASIATSAVGLDANKDAVVNSIGGAQGTAALSESSAGRSTTPLSGRGSTLSQYQEHRVLQRVLKGLEQLDEGGGQVRLRLHPPELGSLQITLRVEAQQVSAMIEVEHSAARDVLLSNLPQLQSRLADQGLNVSQFDVQVVDPNQFSQGSSQGWESSNGHGTGQNNADSNRSSRYIDRLRNQLDGAPTADATRPVQSLWTRKNGELDVRY